MLDSTTEVTLKCHRLVCLYSQTASQHAINCLHSGTSLALVVSTFLLFTYALCAKNKVIRLTPVDLYLISEKSIWKNPVRQIGFLVYFKLDFYCLCSLQKSISKLIFAG